MRLFAFIAALVLVTVPAMAGDKAVQALDANPYGLVGDCETALGVAAEIASGYGVSLGESMGVVDPSGACFGPWAGPNGIAGMPEPLGFGLVIVVRGFGPHTTPTGFGPTTTPTGFGPTTTPTGFGPTTTPTGFGPTTTPTGG